MVYEKRNENFVLAPQVGSPFLLRDLRHLVSNPQSGAKSGAWQPRLTISRRQRRGFGRGNGRGPRKMSFRGLCVDGILSDISRDPKRNFRISYERRNTNKTK